LSPWAQRRVSLPLETMRFFAMLRMTKAVHEQFC